MSDVKELMRQKIEVLDRAARAYYAEGEEIMSNFEYDRIYDELVELEKESGIILAGSPTQRVGYEVLSELPKERHPETRSWWYPLWRTAPAKAGRCTVSRSMISRQRTSL